jgi:hypothetical protein
MFVIYLYIKQETSNLEFGSVRQHVSRGALACEYTHNIAGGTEPAASSASPGKFHKSHGGVTDH